MIIFWFIIVYYKLFWGIAKMGCIPSSTAYFMSGGAIPDAATLPSARVRRFGVHRNAPMPVPMQVQVQAQMEVPVPVLNRQIGKLPVCNRTRPMPMQNPDILSGGAGSGVPSSASASVSSANAEEQRPSLAFLDSSIDDPEIQARIDRIIGFICSQSDHEVALALVQKIQDNFRRQIYATLAKLNRILQSSGLQSHMVPNSFSRAEFEESRLLLIELFSMPSPRFALLATRIEPVITRLYTFFWLIEYMPYVDF
jgi:hypothetical protein